MESNKLVIIDSPTRNWLLNPLKNQNQLLVLFPELDDGQSASKYLVGKRSTSQQSIDFGKINTSGYLDEKMFNHSSEILDNLRTNLNLTESVIIAMGPTITKLLTNKTLKESAGRLIETTEFGKVFPMHHSNAMLTDRYRSETWKRHWVQALELLGKTSAKNLKSLDSFKETQTIPKSDVIAADIETKSKRVEMIGFAKSLNEEVSIISNPDPLILKDMVETKSHYIFHNATHDIEYLNEVIPTSLNNLKVSDTMLMMKCIYPLLAHDLDSCEREIIGEWQSWKHLNQPKETQ